MRATKSFVRVLKIVDNDTHPSMGYLFEGIHKAKDDLVSIFKRNKRRLGPFIMIVSYY